MVVSQKYNIIDLEKGTLDGRVFTDPETYQDELEKIFGLAWLEISHESLIPNPNDFFLSYMGEDPVIVTRDAKGGVHVFLNMCRHRGNRVVRADDGNAKNFMCTYHGWTFSNEGRLVSVPGLQEAYYGELDVERLGLVEARCDTYAGIIFATWAEDAPTLEAYLGDARWYLDTVFNRSDSGMQAYGPDKWTQPVNWKTAVDNCSDFYHVPSTHQATMLAQQKVQGGSFPSALKSLLSLDGHQTHVNGHSINYWVQGEDDVRFAHGMTSRNVHIFEKYYKQVEQEEIRRLGYFRAKRLVVGTHNLFPNTILWFRLEFPRGPLQSEFWHFGVAEKNMPEEAWRTIIRGGQNNGTAGVFEMDDMDNWRQVTEAGSSPARRKIRHRLAMGMGHAGPHPEHSGVMTEKFISENNQRNFYSRWQEFMNAESWKDIHVDPITAKFEGTATMKG